MREPIKSNCNTRDETIAALTSHLTRLGLDIRHYIENRKLEETPETLNAPLVPCQCSSEKYHLGFIIQLNAEQSERQRQGANSIEFQLNTLTRRRIFGWNFVTAILSQLSTSVFWLFINIQTVLCRICIERRRLLSVDLVDKVEFIVSNSETPSAAAIRPACNYDDRWYRITTTANVHVHTSQG